MRLFTYLFKSSRRMVLLVSFAGLMSGIFSAGLIALINYALNHGHSMPRRILLAFVAVSLAKIAAGIISQLLLVDFSQTTLLQLTDDLCRKVLNTPFEKLEQMGPARIQTTLTDDAAVLAAAIQALPALATNIAVLLGCSAYLIYLSRTVFIGMVVMIVFGALSYKVLITRAQAAIQLAREGRERLFGHFRALIEGVKELKLSGIRRTTFMESEIGKTAEFLRHQNLVAITQYMIADGWSQLMFYALIGLLLFAAPSLMPMSLEGLTGYVFATLYMMSPVWVIIGTVPTFVRGQVSLDKVLELGASLESSVQAGTARAVTASLGGQSVTASAPIRLELSRLVFAYQDQSVRDNHFVLGPVDFSLRDGEVVFVTGGNGSGKSTFVKLLVGLYTPQSGQIHFNEEMVDNSNRQSYREYFSAVFSDYYLFDNLLGLASSANEEDLRKYLMQLEMDHKVRIKDGRFSTIALSQGQRKRLALLTAYLEDRPIYVFDEWAADQDPAYRTVFYKQLVPELKRRGKCVVVITHDDRFFHLGDRVVKFESGQLVDSKEHVPR
jgi:putative pyoverdin transport system ATP-binding/permease protein